MNLPRLLLVATAGLSLAACSGSESDPFASINDAAAAAAPLA